MATINTNVAAIAARNALETNQRSMDQSMQRLSTGKNINSAADDAAGLSMIENMTMYRNGLNMAVKNAEDTISLLQTAEGAVIEQTAMLQRMRELAVQAANDTVTSTQRGYLESEFTALRTEIERIGDNTQWNGMDIIDGTGGTAGTFTFHIGANTTQSFTVSITEATDDVDYIAVAASTLATQAGADAAIASLDTAIAAAATKRSGIGAVVNRLSHAIENLSNVSMNTDASMARIADTDYAAETTNLARTQIIQQAATAMLAQANQAPATVLALLQ